jgi:hypothetical protein
VTFCDPGERYAARPARLPLCAALLSLAACGGDDAPVFTRLFTSEHVVYYVEDGGPRPCDGTDRWLERYYRANAGFLGATLPPGERIEYYLVRTTETLQELGCPPAATGCAEGTTVRSINAVFPHELVHANASLLGDPPLLFREGLAEVLGCSSSWEISGPVDTSAPLEGLVETAAFSVFRDANGFGVYAASASFVRYLVDRFGASRFSSFYARAPGAGFREEIEAVFQDVMGSSLDDAFSDWRTRPPPYAGDLCLRVMECDPSTPSLVDAEVTLGCGPKGGHGPSQEALVRFEVPDERVVHVATEPVQAEPQVLSSINFYRCTGGNVIGTPERTAGFRLDADLGVHVDPAQPASAFMLDVPPGEYVAWLTAPEGARVRLDVEERRSPMRGTPCQAAEEPLALDDQRPTTLTSRWIERPCDGPWCPGRSWDVSIGATGGALEAQALVVNSGANLSPGELYICSEPCPEDTSKCEILALDTLDGGRVRSKQTFEPGAVLHVGAPAAPYAGYFAVRLRVAAE